MFQRWPKCSAGKERMFFRTSTLKVHEAGCQKLGVERSKPLSSYVTLLRQVCSNAVGQASALRLKKQNSGSVAVFAPRLSGTPARLVFSHHCTHNLATHLGRSCLAEPVLNCAANEIPAVTTGTPCQAMWQPWTDSPNPSSLGSSAQSSTNSIFPAPARD